MWEKAENNNNKHYIVFTNEKEKLYDVEFFSYEFGEVDVEFIKFIEDRVIDYDMAKSSMFYVVKE